MLLCPYQIFYLKLLIAIFIHELGHIFIAIIFRLKIKSLTLYAFGFIMEFDNYKKIFIKELLLYTFGILFNIVFYFISNRFKHANLMLILINLAPIYPLDGYNILSNIISTIIPYKKSLYITSILGFIPIGILTYFMIIKFDLLSLLTVLYTLFLWYANYKTIPERYNNFLINRFTKKEKYKLKKVNIEKDVLDSFYKYKSIYCVYDNKRIDENELIALKYNLN
jgi:stage IV sporulation protein FB